MTDTYALTHNDVTDYLFGRTNLTRADVSLQLEQINFHATQLNRQCDEMERRLRNVAEQFSRTQNDQQRRSIASSAAPGMAQIYQAINREKQTLDRRLDFVYRYGRHSFPGLTSNAIYRRGREASGRAQGVMQAYRDSPMWSRDSVNSWAWDRWIESGGQWNAAAGGRERSTPEQIGEQIGRFVGGTVRGGYQAVRGVDIGPSPGEIAAYVAIGGGAMVFTGFVIWKLWSLKGKAVHAAADLIA